jgi:hypothetical protein
MTKRASVVGIGFLEFGQEGGRVRRARFYAEGKS